MYVAIAGSHPLIEVRRITIRYSPRFFGSRHRPAGQILGRLTFDAVEVNINSNRQGQSPTERC
jgi:hypothetical protein